MTGPDTPDQSESLHSGQSSPDAESLIHVDSHRALLANARQIIARLQAQPELIPLLGVNPVLALRAAGVTLTPSIADHVLRTFRLSPQARAERDQLESSLTAALGETPKPLDSAWMANLLFEKLGLSPFDIQGRTPVYRPALDADTTRRLAQLLPRSGGGGEGSGSGEVRTALRLVLPETANRLDLDAPVPALAQAADTKSAVSLEEAWFYKDQNPLVRDVLRLALIERTAVPVASTARFRQVQRGEISHPFTSWISGANFGTVKRE
jgi:hypothetical protein